MDKHSFRFLRVSLFVSLFFPLCVLSGRTEAPPDYEVKAAFLYNFARFVEWPDDSFENTEAPLVVGVLGENPFHEALESAVEGKQIDGRRVEVRYARRLDELDDAHLLFVSDSEIQRVPEILERLDNKSVLTVSDIPHFTRAGGCIRLFIRERRIAFEINVAAADEAGLAISSRLLNVAEIYRE